MLCEHFYPELTNRFKSQTIIKRAEDRQFFVAVFLGYNKYWPGGFIVLCSLCPGTPKSSTGCGSDQKMGQWL